MQDVKKVRGSIERLIAFRPILADGLAFNRLSFYNYNKI